jgi:ABC-type branched-subunit amino acid transport system ATPase component
VAERLVIETANLRKNYGATEALRGLNLEVPAGSICGFLGRNGAGKTTTIKILLGMSRPTSGRVRVLGLAPEDADASVQIRRRSGFVSEDKDLYQYMTVEEMVRFTAAFFPRWRRDLEQSYRQAFELPPDGKIKSLSRGSRTKLALLLALCRDAELLVLDEPTSGLDPTMIEQVLQTLVSHVARQETQRSFSRRTRLRRWIRSPTASPSSIAGALWLRARSTISASVIAAFNWCSTAMPRSRRFTPLASCAFGARGVCFQCCRARVPRTCSTRPVHSDRCRSTSCL